MNYYVAYEGDKISWIIKESGTKRITRTGYHVFSTNQRLSLDELLKIEKRYTVKKINSKKMSKEVYDKLSERIDFYRRDWYKNLVGEKRQKSDIKYLDKVRDLLN